MRLTCHKETAKETDALLQSSSMTRPHTGGYLPAYFLCVKLSTWDMASMGYSEEWCSHCPL